MLSGDANNALKEPNTMVITRSLAEKFFPNEDPINKILTFQAGTFKIDSRITGISEDPASNSSLQYGALFSTETIKQSWKDIDQSFYYPEFQTFAKLHSNADYEKVEQNLNAAAEQVRLLADKLKLTITIRMHPFQDFHFFRHHNSYSHEGIRFTGDKKLIFYIAVIAAFITLISIANYINLTTARALKRAKEVGLRKVNGATRGNLIIQFLAESAFLNCISFLLALTLAQILFPVFAQTIGSKATWTVWTIPSFWMVTLPLFVFCTAVSGIYPALVLSNYKPTKVLKGSFVSSQSGMAVRRALVIVQFGLSVILIMSIYVISQQLFFMQNKELGMSVDQVMVIRTNDLDVSLKRDAAYAQLKAKIDNFDHIMNTSSGSNFPGADISRSFAFQVDSDPDKKTKPLLVNQVGPNYFNTMELTLQHGRDFNDDPSGDMDHAIINETAAREFGFARPETSIGHQLILPETGAKYEIIGVLKDFNLNMKAGVPGEVFFKHYLNTIGVQPTESPADFLFVKLSTKDLRLTVANIEKAWSNLFPLTPFDYFFLDTHFNTFYKEERQFAGVFAFFAVIGVLITCMGLFGLSLFDTTSRTKEIGIRKALGATERSIMWLFSKSYIKLVLIAGLLAMPVGIVLLKQWLDSYPQRISLTADAVFLPLTLMCCIAIVTVGYHTFKTACINPVKSLRAD